MLVKGHSCEEREWYSEWNDYRGGSECKAAWRKNACLARDITGRKDWSRTNERTKYKLLFDKNPMPTMPGLNLLMLTNRQFALWIFAGKNSCTWRRWFAPLGRRKTILDQVGKIEGVKNSGTWRHLKRMELLLKWNNNSWYSIWRQASETGLAHDITEKIYTEENLRISMKNYVNCLSHLENMGKKNVPA
jgi:hypothetical protein